MPSEGAKVIEIEAPVKEPLRFSKAPGEGDGIAVRGLCKNFPPRGGRRNYLRRAQRLDVRDDVSVDPRLDVLDNVSVDVRPLEVVGIVGPSGCGKSTLLELIAGLQGPSSGEISIGEQRDGLDRLAQCALMPQHDLLLPWRSALDNAGLALELGGAPRAAARARVMPLFERFGLAGFEQTPPYELSGGMRQRVAFLRTLLAGKPVLLLDEPFGSLDSITRADMQEWLRSALLETPHTVLLVTHDAEEALFVCDRVLVLSARPGHIRAEFAVDVAHRDTRRETVTSPEFSALKESVLEALA
jgi:ABC-type nitrate/sulfonate/bicarbonate transport system ATPase subunit